MEIQLRLRVNLDWINPPGPKKLKKKNTKGTLEAVYAKVQNQEISLLMQKRNILHKSGKKNIGIFFTNEHDREQRSIVNCYIIMTTRIRRSIVHGK